MIIILLDEPVPDMRPTDAPAPTTLPERGRETSGRACPVCGSSATYQTMDGRWGCTACGSTWA
ncbi:hypothetical protein ACFQ6N_38135 [Kitasatospora sp. NPDC056446]|uniref:hypothetical protein n=1 Tax=Kitasatospora sp. NPDC056446 TaxID=3345819 RepID=UPI00369B67EA